MLITPRPGADRRSIRDALRHAHTAAMNLRGHSGGDAYQRLLRYLEWATETAGTLRYQVSDADVDHLVLTRRYQALLSSCGSLAGSYQERLVNGLVELEITERVQAFESAQEALDTRIREWSELECFVVADSSFYCHNPEQLKEVDLHKILDLRSHENVRLLFPITVVDELDGLKESGKQQGRWRASHTLGLLDELLRGRTSGIWHRGGFLPEAEEVRGKVNVEIVLDPPGHVRLPIPDDEIIDRTVAIQALAAREVRMLTCDTGQHTRGRAAGLNVTKIPAKDLGPEPDWEAMNKAGSGTRAARRERQAAQTQAAHKPLGTGTTAE
ncbi:PIN domain-containing protein [Streptomyces sp. MS2.AVA.5]|uniref:PIN domain-containing protein n=1 Tax=Streptomyces achmelvichensis TaxID=3134111 RepID=A0ACC6PL05_9ACTN